MRTTGSALFLLINNLLGIGGGLYYYGAVSDALKPWAGAESMRWSIYSGMGFYLLADRALPHRRQAAEEGLGGIGRRPAHSDRRRRPSFGCRRA